MERDVAIRLDGMLSAAQAVLDGIAYHLKNNLPAEDYAIVVRSIGGAMGELIDASNYFHARFPDIVPRELRLPGS